MFCSRHCISSGSSNSAGDTIIGTTSNIAMIPTTYALLICVMVVCGLGEAADLVTGHCADNRCFGLFQEPQDFQGAQKRCKELGAQLFRFSLGDTALVKEKVSGFSGRYWLEFLSTSRTKEGIAPGPSNCSSISTPTGQDTVLWKPCHEKLDGFLCQYAVDEPCSTLQAGDDKQVTYSTYATQMGFDATGSEIFPAGTIAEAEKAGDKYPDSKHLCFSKSWLRAPWRCEVLKGGCEHSCSAETNTCTCPAGLMLHPNNISCIKDTCASCAHGCQKEGDTYVCTCKKGFRLAPDGSRCVDINECQEGDPCTGEGVECENTAGGFECLCKHDFWLDDGVCVDLRFCKGCEHECGKVNGTYQCICRKGYRVSPKNHTRCEQYCPEKDCPSFCTTGEEESDKFCYCPDGYISDVVNDTDICTDINECENANPCDHQCINTFGSYKCLCNEGFEPRGDRCERIREEEEEEEDGSGSTPSHPSAGSAPPAAVPSYIKTGSVLGIAVFALMSVALLYLLTRNIAKRCGRFELSSFKHPDIDIFYLQQVTSETYKRLSFDKQFKTDPQIL